MKSDCTISVGMCSLILFLDHTILFVTTVHLKRGRFPLRSYVYKLKMFSCYVLLHARTFVHE